MVQAESVEEAVRLVFGADTEVRARRAVGGGCINQAAILGLSGGITVFLKENSARFRDMFRAEALGLSALRAAGGPRVPEPLACGEGPTGQFLLIEYIEEGRKTAGFWERFGQELAELHRTNTQAHCGFASDNYIGSNIQENGWTASWTEFFGEMRLRRQLELARRNGYVSGVGNRIAAGVERLIARLSSLLSEPASASLLHGDLWAGNYMVGQSGEPVLIDPAVYYGHREAELAMTELFGGFDRRFYSAYADSFPIEPGYAERRDIYNLYHMLNHLNLFGRSYEGSVSSILARYA